MRKRPNPRRVWAGIQTLAAGANLERHQHAAGYVTLILDGAYEQIGYAGRLWLQAGDVLVQPLLDCHANTMRSAGVRLMRLPWRHDATFGGVWRGFDIDDICRIGKRDAGEAAQLVAGLVDAHSSIPPVIDHWVDLLAARLTADPKQLLAPWANAGIVTREAASRAFRAHYGVSPSGFRAEVRARAAVMRSVGSVDPLAFIAFDLGFSDQPHMTRSVVWLTGMTPGMWRRRSLCSTAPWATEMQQTARSNAAGCSKSSALIG